MRFELLKILEFLMNIYILSAINQELEMVTILVLQNVRKCIVRVGGKTDISLGHVISGTKEIKPSNTDVLPIRYHLLYRMFSF